MRSGLNRWHTGANGEQSRASLIHETLLALAVLISSCFPSTSSADMAPVVPVPENPASQLKLPPGFTATIFAKLRPAGGDYFRGPRFMAFGPDGHLYLSLGRDNQVVMFPDRNRDGRADETVVIASNLNAPQGLAFVGDKLLVANQDAVVQIERGRAVPLIPDLPAGGHALKTLKLGPDGFLYLNVGSSCNVCAEADPQRAALLRFSLDGKPAGALPSLGRHPTSPVWADGLRNAQGFAWHPTTGDLYATNAGADMRASTRGGKPQDDLPPEHFNRIERGGNYGWPYCWGNRVPDPNFPGPQGFCEQAIPPALMFPAHSTPIGMTFLASSHFPAAFKDDALVALHGSWNREFPSGYKVVRVSFKEGRPVGVSDFMTGWLDTRGAWGRPVDVVVGPDGSVYVSDDRAGMIYRIRYIGESP